MFHVGLYTIAVIGPFAPIPSPHQPPLFRLALLSDTVTRHEAALFRIAVGINEPNARDFRPVRNLGRTSKPADDRKCRALHRSRERDSCGFTRRLSTSRAEPELHIIVEPRP